MIHPLISTALADEHRADLRAAAQPGCCAASGGRSFGEWLRLTSARLHLREERAASSTGC